MPSRLRFEIPGARALLAQEGHLANAGLFVPDVQPRPVVGSVVTLRICTPFAEDVEVEGRVVQVFPGTGFALFPTNLEGARETLAPAFAAARSNPVSDDPPRVCWESDEDAMPQMALDDLLVDDDESGGHGNDVDGGGDRNAHGHGNDPDDVDRDDDGYSNDVDSDGDGNSDVASEHGDDGERRTLYDRITNLPTAERMRIARNGTRSERSVLLKDRNKNVHVFLVQNPRITLDEIRYMAAYRQCNPEALKMISENRIWMQNQAVVGSLVRNPKTPSSVAIRLLDKLPPADVNRIARTGNAPRAVVEAAKRKAISSGS